jgi:hypothetical protein
MIGSWIGVGLDLGPFYHRCLAVDTTQGLDNRLFVDLPIDRRSLPQSAAAEASGCKRYSIDVVALPIVGQCFARPPPECG